MNFGSQHLHHRKPGHDGAYTCKRVRELEIRHSFSYNQTGKHEKQ